MRHRSGGIKLIYKNYVEKLTENQDYFTKCWFLNSSCIKTLVLCYWKVINLFSLYYLWVGDICIHKHTYRPDDMLMTITHIDAKLIFFILHYFYWLIILSILIDVQVMNCYPNDGKSSLFGKPFVHFSLQQCCQTYSNCHIYDCFKA